MEKRQEQRKKATTFWAWLIKFKWSLNFFRNPSCNRIQLKMEKRTNIFIFLYWNHSVMNRRSFLKNYIILTWYQWKEEMKQGIYFCCVFPLEWRKISGFGINGNVSRPIRLQHYNLFLFCFYFVSPIDHVTCVWKWFYNFIVLIQWWSSIMLEVYLRRR